MVLLRAVAAGDWMCLRITLATDRNYDVIVRGTRFVSKHIYDTHAYRRIGDEHRRNGTEKRFLHAVMPAKSFNSRSTAVTLRMALSNPLPQNTDFTSIYSGLKITQATPKCWDQCVH